jgi:hypothetical protein
MGIVRKGIKTAMWEAIAEMLIWRYLDRNDGQTAVMDNAMMPDSIFRKLSNAVRR